MPFNLNNNLADTIKLVGDTSKKEVEGVDTIYGVKSERLIPYRKTEYQNKEAHTLNKEELLKPPIKKEVGVMAWQSSLLILSVFIVAFVKAFNNNRFKQSVKALFSYSVSQEITREEKVFFHRANLLLIFVYITCLSLFVYDLLSQTLQRNDLILIDFIYIVLFVMSAYILKFIFAKILFYIFHSESLSLEYIFNVSLFNNLLGVLLIPSLSFIYFSTIRDLSIIYYFAFPCILIVFIMRIVRLFVLGGNKGVSYLYIFLYICTLEILPLVVLYRFFILK